MLVRFNWNKILRTANYKPSAVINLFCDLVKNEVPEQKYSNLYRFYGKDFSGDSFLAYPETFLDYRYQHSPRDLCCYLSLASTRSLAEYRRAKTLTLPIRLAKLDPRDILTNKTICPVDGDNIHFLYEIPLDEARGKFTHSASLRFNRSK
jgi:hypothetical protein